MRDFKSLSTFEIVRRWCLLSFITLPNAESRRIENMVIGLKTHFQLPFVLMLKEYKKKSFEVHSGCTDASIIADESWYLPITAKGF